MSDVSVKLVPEPATLALFVAVTEPVGEPLVVFDHEYVSSYGEPVSVGAPAGEADHAREAEVLDAGLGSLPSRSR